MWRAILTVGALLLLALGGYVALQMNDGVQDMVPSQLHSDPDFEWTYRSSVRDDIPYTEISLTARYTDGEVEKRVIDTVEGECNAYEDAEEETYVRSTMVICYYAGLGRYYKVIGDGGGYAVQRRVFEEGSPEYSPPPQPFETITRF